MHVLYLNTCSSTILSQTANQNTLVTDHGEEDAELGVHVDVVAVGEDELLLPLFLARQHDGDLLRGDRQHRQLDAVELVEAAPRPRLRQTCSKTLALMTGNTVCPFTTDKHILYVS